jgi:hypothetical protein
MEQDESRAFADGKVANYFSDLDNREQRDEF